MTTDLIKALEAAKRIVAQQETKPVPSLCCEGITASERYLQAELRRLQAAVKSIAAHAALGDVQADPERWHELKTDPEVFDDVAAGLKTHEIRRNDRDFKVGDGLLLRKTRYTGQQMHMRPEACPLEYTGDECKRIVSHVLSGYGLQDGWVILSFADANPQVAPDVGAEFDSNEISALRWLLNITTEFDRKDVRTRQAARLLDDYSSSDGRTNRQLLESAWAKMQRAESNPADPLQELADESQHTDDIAVDRFAAAMKLKLAEARAKGRGGWETCGMEFLQESLFKHVSKGDPRDVANFAMMLWCRSEPTAYQDQWVFDITGRWPGVTERKPTPLTDIHGMVAGERTCEWREGDCEARSGCGILFNPYDMIVGKDCPHCGGKITERASDGK